MGSNVSSLYYFPLLCTMVVFVIKNALCIVKCSSLKERIAKGFLLIPCTFEFWLMAFRYFVYPKVYRFSLTHDILGLSLIIKYNALWLLALLAVQSFILYAYYKIARVKFGITLGMYAEFVALDCLGMLFYDNLAMRMLVESVLLLYGYLLICRELPYVLEHESRYKAPLYIRALFLIIPLYISFPIATNAIMMESSKSASIIMIVSARLMAIFLHISSILFIRVMINSIKQSINLQNTIIERDKLNQQLIDEQANIVMTFSEITENKSGETGQHVKRVGEYCAVLARELGFNDEYVEQIRLASMMHDIGKLMIPNEIIEKPGKLTNMEFAVMQQHVAYGAELLNNTEGSILKLAKNIALEHHERWDGKGYIYGLVGDEIHIEAQMAAVADVFDALTSRRSYKNAWSCDDARDEILKGRGTQFSPVCVDAFINRYDEFVEIRKQYPDNDDLPVLQVINGNANLNKISTTYMQPEHSAADVAAIE